MNLSPSTDDVDWLVNYMNAATVRGELLTVQTIILLEKESNHEYTRCEDTMAMLRDVYRKNMERIVESGRTDEANA